MGREIKRVALNFDWPIGKIWKGYINPYSKHIKDCTVCQGRGVNLEYYFLECLWYAHKHNEISDLIKKISNPELVKFAHIILESRSLSTMFFNWAEYYGVSVKSLEPLRDKVFNKQEFEVIKNNLNKPSGMLLWIMGECAPVGWCNYLDEDDIKALIRADRLWDFTRIPLNEDQERIIKEKKENGGNSWLPFNNGKIPAPEEINKWSSYGFGHDSINASICIKDRLKRSGVFDYNCPACKGHGELKMPRKIKKAYGTWKDFEPPSGDGYQLWSTTTEGHPMSPVFDTPEKLAMYLSDNNVSSFGSDTCTYEQWLNFINGPAWAPSAISMDGKIMSGVKAVAHEHYAP